MKKVTITFVLGLLFFLSIFSFMSKKKVVVIDAGHGGHDLGATYEGTNEKDIVLNIAKKIKEFNTDENVEIILTRTEDAAPSLAERVELINNLNPAMVISLHVNSSPKAEASSGKEIYSQETSKELGGKLASKFEDCKKVETKNLHLLRNCNSPTLLLELGYMNNESERKNLQSESGQIEISKKILEFIEENQ